MIRKLSTSCKFKPHVCCKKTTVGWHAKIKLMSLRLRSSFLLLFFCFYFSSAMSDEMEGIDKNKPFPPKKTFYWSQGHFDWYYSSFLEPPWVNKEDAVKLFQHAAQTWEACGLQINFKGVLESPVKQQDRLNVMGWRQLAAPIRALTLRQTKFQSEELLEADIIVNIVNKDIQNDPRLLQKVVDHEFGHALGLIHSEGCSDVMSSAFECGPRIANPPPPSVTEKDMAQCRLRYPAP